MPTLRAGAAALVVPPADDEAGGVAVLLLFLLPQAASDSPASASAATPTTKDPRTRRNAGLLSPGIRHGETPPWRSDHHSRTGRPLVPERAVVGHIVARA